MSVAQAITQHFGGKWHGSYGSFPALGHSKGDRGVTVKDEASAPDGVLINSFNGADPLAIKDECRRVGILPPRARANDNAPRETGHYEYVDRDGVVLYRTVRIEEPGQKKRFVAQLPDGRGGWKTRRLGDTPRVLYRLPDIADALKNEKNPLILLVEGERKADKLASWGLLATSCAFGCKGWRRSYAEELAGCTVVILPDNDDEGRDFAERAARDIEAHHGTAHIVELPGLPAKGDIIDWTGTVDELRELVDGAINPPAETFPIADLAAWERTEPKPKPFLMAGFVPSRELTLATGAGGANKSTFGQQLATCVAAGLPMLGVDVMQGNALYVTAEDDEDRLHWMQAHICKAVGVSIGSLVGKLHLVSLRGRLGNEIATFDMEGKLRPSPSYHVLRATIERTGARLVVLDNVAHLFAGNENDRQQVTAFINLLYSLCQDLGATVILIAHPNKAGDTYSGSTAWLNAVRSQIVLGRPDDAQDPDERTLTLGKANYARQGQELRFRWHDFALRLDDDLPDDTRREMAANVAASSANIHFLAMLDECLANRRAVSHVKGTNYAPTIFNRMPNGKKFSVRAYEEALERLLHMGQIKLNVPLFQDAHRKWKQGIQRSEMCGDPPAATPCGDLRQPHSQAIDNACGDLRAATPLYTTYIEGGGQGAAPPSDTDIERDQHGGGDD